MPAAERTPETSPGGPEDGAGIGPPGDPETVARLICLRQLDRRARSRTELAQILNARGVPDEAANRVLDRFAEVGLIDDTALADGLALAQHRERGLAPRAVALKLRQRGIGEDTVQAAVAQIDPESELSVARRLVEQRRRSMQGLDASVQARRLIGMLARKGYQSGLAYRVVRECLSDLGEADLAAADMTDD